MLVMTTIFISKMEGLPPTSNTKMIDYWLILCQLVPFAQVVLLTAMEFLREEEQGEKQISDKEEPQPAEPTNEKQESNVHVEEEEEAKPIVPKKLSRTSFVPMLRMIGKFFVVEVRCLNIFLFREESDALDLALCLFRLLCNCCKFLSSIIFLV